MTELLTEKPLEETLTQTPPGHDDGHPEDIGANKPQGGSNGGSRVIGGADHHLHGERRVNDDAAAWAESPAKPEWNPGKPGFVGRRLMKIAGVDLYLARTMPDDEQRQMKRVGLSLLFGAAFQFICFSTALTVAFGPQAWVLPVTLTMVGVLWCFDSKFVGADWVAQGRAFCRDQKLIPDADSFERFKRIAAIAIRWMVSLFIASTLAIFVLLKLFGPDIERRFAHENRVQNQSIVEATTLRHQALLAEQTRRTELSDRRIETLGREYAPLAAASGASLVDFDKQIAGKLDQIRKLETDRDEATKAAAAHRRDVRAEQHGIRLTDGNTGLRGKGNHHNFHADMATDQDNIAKARAADIVVETAAVAELRRQRAAMLELLAAPHRARLETLTRQLSDEHANRSALTAEYRRLQDGRETWITARMRETPGYVPMPEGILAKLEALAAIIASSSLIASLVLFTKLVIMAMESAGPLAKIAFTAPGLYQMAVALRLHDLVELEGDRRLKWQHWRLMARSRNHQAIDAMNVERRRRETSNRARDAFNKTFEKFAWMH